MRRKNRTIHMTADDTVNFVAGDPTRCLLALPAIRAFPDAVDVKVTNGFIKVTFDDDVIWWYHIPKNPATYVAAVDAHLDIQLEPISFCISKPLVEKKKAVKVRAHKRCAPNATDAKKGSARSTQQQSATARVRRALRAEYGSATRFLGIEV
jgi:hypothetical protein